MLEGIMKVHYDEKTDTLTVVLRDDPVAQSDEERPGLIFDFDGAGHLVSLEILEASKRVHDPRTATLGGDAKDPG